MQAEISKIRGQFVFSGFFTAHFACFGIVLPFLPLWMEAKGIESGDVGLILGAAYLSKVFFGNLIGALSDATGHRKYWILALALLNLAGFTAFSFTDSFWEMFLVWVIVGPLLTSVIPMIDGLAISASRRGYITYGPVRLFGSISFILFSTAVGYYLDYTSVLEVPKLMVLAAIIVVVMVLPLPDLRPRNKAGRKFAVLDVLKIPGFLPIALIAASLQASHGALYAIGSLHWARSGLEQDVIGLLWAEGVLAEVVLFAFAALLVRKLGVRGLFWLAASMGAFR
ncbi:MAG: MFS transporter, partial [Alphaproteobacteria bacterium]|nr:MFS transporter [Alphaproteobacteria bacterium]